MIETIIKNRLASELDVEVFSGKNQVQKSIVMLFLKKLAAAREIICRLLFLRFKVMQKAYMLQRN